MFSSGIHVLTSVEEHPLATQVPIMQGSVLVTCPQNPSFGYGPNYTVVGKYPVF